MRCELTEADIISTWAGYRPLISAHINGKPSSKVSRTHVVVDGPGGMVTVVGGKLTTYRRMAQDTLDHVSRKLGKPISHVTEHLPLLGADGWEAAKSALPDAAKTYGLRDDTVQRLGKYGGEAAKIIQLMAADRTLAERIVPDLPYVMAEVVYACRYQMAIMLDDVLVRRMHINFEDWSRGVEAAPHVASCMAHELNWDQPEIERQVNRYLEQVGATTAHRPAESPVR
jgi:glycerol-3-phosphate dehydrogenase